MIFSCQIPIACQETLLELWLREVFLTEELADRLGLHEKYNLYRS